MCGLNGYIHFLTSPEMSNVEKEQEVYNNYSLTCIKNIYSLTYKNKQKKTASDHQ